MRENGENGVKINFKFFLFYCKFQFLFFIVVFVEVPSLTAKQRNSETGRCGYFFTTHIILFFELTKLFSIVYFYFRLLSNYSYILFCITKKDENLRVALITLCSLMTFNCYTFNESRYKTWESLKEQSAIIEIELNTEKSNPTIDSFKGIIKNKKEILDNLIKKDETFIFASSLQPILLALDSYKLNIDRFVNNNYAGKKNLKAVYLNFYEEYLILYKDIIEFIDSQKSRQEVLTLLLREGIDTFVTNKNEKKAWLVVIDVFEKREVSPDTVRAISNLIDKSRKPEYKNQESLIELLKNDPATSQFADYLKDKIDLKETKENIEVEKRKKIAEQILWKIVEHGRLNPKASPEEIQSEIKEAAKTVYRASSTDQSNNSDFKTYPQACTVSNRIFSKEPPCIMFGDLYIATVRGSNKYISDAYIDSFGITRTSELQNSIVRHMPAFTALWSCKQVIKGWASYLCPGSNSAKDIDRFSSFIGFTGAFNRGVNNRGNAMAIGLSLGSLILDKTVATVMGVSVGGYWDTSIKQLPPDIKLNQPFPYLRQQFSTESLSIIDSITGHTVIPTTGTTGQYGYIGFFINFKI